VNVFADYHDLFAASVGATAALIGLLFVAISIAPERTFGAEADAERRADAQRAFTALANVFFVSLCILMPHSARQGVVVVALFGIGQALVAARGLLKGIPSWTSLLHVGLLSLGIYVFELVTALRILHGTSSPDTLVYIILGLYAYALRTSWGLLGAKDGAKVS
jgi:hypothetical protein